MPWSIPLEERAILAQSKQPNTRRSRWWLGLAAIPLLGVVAAFGIAPGTVTETVDRRQVLQELPLRLAEEESESESIAKYYREERIQRGDTLGSILTRLTIDDSEAINQLRSTPLARSLYQLRPGRTVKAVTSDDGVLLSLRYVTPQGTELRAERVAIDRMAVTERPLALQPRLSMASGRIRSSLFQAIDDAGLDDNIATQLAEIFSGEIDFHRDLQPGDRFSVVYESLYDGAEYVRSGRVTAAEFQNGSRKFRALLHTDASGRNNYYSEDGKNLKKSFLRSPLEFSRITSGFSSARFHPVLETWRAHRGVDYGAPTGTRVRATADGMVRFAGQMRGYGNVVILKHPNGFESLYGHLSGFGSGIRVGTRIQQSDVLGFVGMTGMATGPHLHYELRVNGIHQNPLQIVAPPALGISGNAMASFRQSTQPLLGRLNLLRGIDVAYN